LSKIICEITGLFKPQISLFLHTTTTLQQQQQQQQQQPKTTTTIVGKQLNSVVIVSQ